MEVKKKTKPEKKERNKTWDDLSQLFIANILYKAKDTASNKIKSWFDEIRKRTIGAILSLIGFIFILICTALYINTFVSEEASWIGYGFVGILVLAVGYFLSKNNN